MTKASGVGERRKGRRIFSVSREMSVAFPLQTLWCHGESSRCAFSMARHGYVRAQSRVDSDIGPGT